MPRFFLHVRNGFGFAEDGEGHELANLDAAKAAAVAGARSLMSEEVSEGHLDLRGRIEIADEAGELLAIVQFEDVVNIVKGPLPPEIEGR